MTPQDVEIIKAKHYHGLTPAVIAQQLELPAREVARITGKLPVPAKFDARVIRQRIGNAEFTGPEVADLLDMDGALVTAHLCHMEKRGRAERVGKTYAKNCRYVTVWRLRGEG